MNRYAKASLLLFFFSLCAVAAIMTRTVANRTPPPAPHELYAVVHDQLAAFRADDFGNAYRLASSGVQQKFSVDQFRQMICRQFAEMTTERRVEFGKMEVRGAGASVEVFIKSEAGFTFGYLYNLSVEEEGWRIESVEPLPRPAFPPERAGLRI